MSPRRTRPTFRQGLALVHELGFAAESAEDAHAHFGSWWIVMLRAPDHRLRLVWDGRDARLYLQTPAPERAAQGWDPWEDCWSAGLEAGPLDALRQKLATSAA